MKIFKNEDFGFFQVTVEQPVRKNDNLVLDKKGEPKADSKNRDTENKPLSEDIEEYFEREVKPHVPDAWIDYNKTRIGYEINYTKYFYQYQKQESSAVLKEQIGGLEGSISGLLNEILNE